MFNGLQEHQTVATSVTEKEGSWKTHQTSDLIPRLLHTNSSSYLLSSRFLLLRPWAKDFKSYFQQPPLSISFDGGNFISEKRMGVPTITSMALIRHTPTAPREQKGNHSNHWTPTLFFFFCEEWKQLVFGRLGKKWYEWNVPKRLSWKKWLKPVELWSLSGGCKTACDVKY